MPFKMEQLTNFGVIIIFVGFLIVIIGLLNSSKEGYSKTKVAVGGFIGFIPFGFGNDKKLVWFVTILSVILFLFWLFVNFRTIKGN